MRDVLHQSVEPASLFFTDRRHDRQPGVCSPVCLCNITLAIGDALALWIDQPIRLATSVLAWFGAPIGIKCSMYLVGNFFDFPLKISTFFGDADAIFTVVDLLSLFTAVLIYNMLFYYLTRMIVSPHFAQILWRRDIAPSLSKRNAHLP